MSRLQRRADWTLPAGLALGYLADLALGDPRRWHPVAGFGTVAARLETFSYRDRRSAGVLHVAALLGGVAGLGSLLSLFGRERPSVKIILVGLSTWAVLGGRSLITEAEVLQRQLAADDLVAARRQITHLVGRDPARLTAADLARATVESVAENTSDAVVAPLFWGAVLGIPGLLGYRAINTLDAMIGHRSDRYRRFGWAAARIDDVVNWLPARIGGGLAAVTAPLVGGRPKDALIAVRTQAGRHPSPNAGVVEAAFAGALGVRLGGINSYQGVEENRGTLGFGDQPTIADVSRSARLSRLVGVGAAAVAVGLAAAFGRRRS
ncbi:cobalamin biosynthesis protein CobD [Microlunatus endophyticus]|uniref:Cobalamin biosynthesis protein CobD n=1 Tax=Microlunatus endophyticus TaxID=1716077 RepID=A0A917W3U6_9ACTN|nr:cobalamin biosynthesis protein [Microlunatus endophyticus]GGL59625.1 cobalamin biosynthesis protein CobD [Microlunatus endophyticus]